jgi:hypothetical protein
MAVEAPEVPSVFTNGLTIVNIVALFLVLGYQVAMEYLKTRSKRHEDNKLGKLTDAVSDFLAAMKERNAATDAESEAYRSTAHDFMNDMRGTMSGVRKMMTDMLNRNAGFMNKDNSLRLIEQSFTSITRDATTIFSNSLESDGYANRKDFVRVRVKTLIGQTLDNLRNSLSYFQMSVDLDLFFETDPNETSTVRYVLANNLWDAVEPLYLQQRDSKERLEEMRLNVTLCVGDYLTGIKNRIKE